MLPEPAVKKENKVYVYKEKQPLAPPHPRCILGYPKTVTF